MLNLIFKIKNLLPVEKGFFELYKWEKALQQKELALEILFIYSSESLEADLKSARWSQINLQLSPHCIVIIHTGKCRLSHHLKTDWAAAALVYWRTAEHIRDKGKMVAQIEQIPALQAKKRWRGIIFYIYFYIYFCMRIYLFSPIEIFRIKTLMWKAGLRFCLKCCEFAKSKAEKLNRVSKPLL